jgi:hypothetical protein
MEDNAHAGQGAVVLDIGGDIGALIVSMPAEMEGIEIEICPAGDRPAGHVPHVAVIGRPTDNGTRYSAVFPEVRSGTYDLNQRHRDVVAFTASVVGGDVAFATWPAMPSTITAGGQKHG